jgi:hypothetical protein
VRFGALLDGGYRVAHGSATLTWLLALTGTRYTSRLRTGVQAWPHTSGGGDGSGDAL